MKAAQRSASEFGLPEGNKSEYQANRVFRKDGAWHTVPSDYVPNPKTDVFPPKMKIHWGIDYSSKGVDGTSTSLPFTAGVSGHVELVKGSKWNTIRVKLQDHSYLEFLHASKVLVSDGQAVTPKTVLGMTGNTRPKDEPPVGIHLHVQAKDSKGKPANPDVIGR